jgi:hypothetical protein
MHQYIKVGTKNKDAQYFDINPIGESTESSNIN